MNSFLRASFILPQSMECVCCDVHALMNFFIVVQLFRLLIYQKILRKQKRRQFLPYNGVNINTKKYLILLF